MPIPTVEDMEGVYRCGEAISCKKAWGNLVEEAAGTTEHLPFIHPQLPAPRSSGYIGNYIPVLMPGSRSLSGDSTGRGRSQHRSYRSGYVVTVEVGEVVFVAPSGGGGEDAVHPARSNTTMQMTGNTIECFSIQWNDRSSQLLNRMDTTCQKKRCRLSLRIPPSEGSLRFR